MPSAYYLYRIGIHWVAAGAGVTSVLLLLCFPQFSAEVPDARPYTLGAAAHVVGLQYLLQWLQSGGRRNHAAWVALSALAVYFHPLFALNMAVFVGFALRSSVRAAVQSAIAAAFLIAPNFVQLYGIGSSRKLLQFAEKPSILDLVYLSGAIPIGFVFLLILAGGLAFPEAGSDRNGEAPKSDLFLYSTISGPVLLSGLFAASLFADAGLFEARYTIPAVPGLVLFWTLLMQRF